MSKDHTTSLNLYSFNIRAIESTPKDLTLPTEKWESNVGNVPARD